MSHRPLISAFLLIAWIGLQVNGKESNTTDASIGSGEEISFDLNGKTREGDGGYEFFVPHHEVYTTFVLSEEPRRLCARMSRAGAEQMQDLDGLEMNRWRIVGRCILNPHGKGHIITAVETIEPIGNGVVFIEDRDLVGTLEVLGDLNAEDYLTKSSMHFHCNDGIVFRIPAKKFTPQPSGLSYQAAALFDKKPVRMKARVQIFREQPYRVATVFEFAEVGSGK